MGVFSLLQYMAVVFAIEEVTFRMLDSHLHEADLGRGVLSAVFISAVRGPVAFADRSGVDLGDGRGPAVRPRALRRGPVAVLAPDRQSRDPRPVPCAGGRDPECHHGGRVRRPVG